MDLVKDNDVFLCISLVMDGILPEVEGYAILFVLALLGVAYH